MNCSKTNCEICDEKVGLWEYVWGITFKEFLSVVRWDVIVFMVICLVTGYVIGSWLGLVGGWIFFYLMGRSEDGAIADWKGEFPPEVYPPNECSAKIEGCNICNNEYSHEFNEKYERSNPYHRLW